jgi:phosphocarrier protein HPr
MEREVTVVNRLGLHARPAAEFVRCARQFEASIVIKKDGESYSAASILDVLTASLECGVSMILDADGPDAEEALETLTSLLLEFRQQEER